MRSRRYLFLHSEPEFWRVFCSFANGILNRRNGVPNFVDSREKHPRAREAYSVGTFEGHESFPFLHAVTHALYYKQKQRRGDTRKSRKLRRKGGRTRRHPFAAGEIKQISKMSSGLTAAFSSSPKPMMLSSSVQNRMSESYGKSAASSSPGIFKKFEQHETLRKTFHKCMFWLWR